MKNAVKNPRIVIALALAAMVMVVYARTMNYAFIWYDDDQFIFNNPHVRYGLSLRNIVWAFQANLLTEDKLVVYWCPLPSISHMIIVSAFGLRAGAHHLVNVLLHMVNTLLLFWLLDDLTRARWKSAFVAAVFALHPLQVSAVAWVTQRKDVLCVFFLLLAIRAYVDYSRAPSGRRYLALLTWFACALMSKPVAVTLPLALLVLDFWPLGRVETDTWRGRARLVGEKVPLFVLSAMVGAIVLAFGHGGLPQRPLEVFTIGPFAALATYFCRFFWPGGMAVFYPAWQYPLPVWKVTGSILLVVGVTGFAFWRRRRNPALLAGWLWFFLFLLPVLGGTMENAPPDRFSYLALIGAAIMVAWGVPALFGDQPWRPVFLACAAALVLVVAAFTAWIQAGYWKNSLTLFQHNLEVVEFSPPILNNISCIYMMMGRTDVALETLNDLAIRSPRHPGMHYNIALIKFHEEKNYPATIEYCAKAVDIEPTNSSAQRLWADAALEMGDTPAAVAHLREAIRADGNNTTARVQLGRLLLKAGQNQEAIEQYEAVTRLLPQEPQAYYELGTALGRLGRFQEGIRQLQKALELAPRLPDPHNSLGVIAKRMGNYELARYHFNEAARLDPNNPECRRNLGVIQDNMGQYDEAIRNLRRSLELSPDYVLSLCNLADLLAACPDTRTRNGAEAVRLADSACQLTKGQMPEALEVLAEAYAENGRFREAQATALKARKLAAAAGNSPLVAFLDRKIALYRAGRPYHRPGPLAVAR